MGIVYRVCALALFALAVCSAFADSAIRLTAFPTVQIADGRSTVAITAEVRDQSGRTVPDGTRIFFDSSLGNFRDQYTATIGGLARAVLVSNTAGFATITVQALIGDSSPTTLQYQFVATRQELSSAKEYVEVVSPGYMQYAAGPPTAPDAQIIGAASGNGGVSLRYREVSMKADDIQYSINSYEVRARHVTLTIGKFTKKFDELFFRLKTRSGYGTTTYKIKRPDTFITQGLGFAFVKQSNDGKLTIPPEVDHYGVAAVHHDGVSAPSMAPAAYSDFFKFEDISKAPSSVAAKKAIVFPRRKIQFQQATIYIAGQKIFRIPLYEYDLTQVTPLVTEQMLGVVDNQVEVNYPYIIAMKPGLTELFRLRTGDQYGRTDEADHGIFLDYELQWDKGDDMQGSFVFSGIGRNDWEAGLNQFMRIDERTSISADIVTPTLTSYLGSLSASRQFDGYSVSLNADASQTVQGIQYSTSDYSAVIAEDPIKLGTLPIRMTPELTATTTSDQLIGETQSGVGARLKLQSLPIPIDKTTTFVGSFTTSYLNGENELAGLEYLGTAAFTKKFNPFMTGTLTYTYTHDGFTEEAIGEHQVSFQGGYNKKNTTVSVYASKSLDIEQATLFVDMSYRLSGLWRLTADYTYDDFLTTTFINYDFGFLYKLGWREVGLIWSEQTRSFGFQLLGSTFR